MNYILTKSTLETTSPRLVCEGCTINEDCQETIASFPTLEAAISYREDHGLKSFVYRYNRLLEVEEYIITEYEDGEEEPNGFYHPSQMLYEIRDNSTGRILDSTDSLHFAYVFRNICRDRMEVEAEDMGTEVDPDLSILLNGEEITFEIY